VTDPNGSADAGTTSSGITALETHDRAAYTAARELLAAGVPLFIATRDASRKEGYKLPYQWERQPVSFDVLAAWRPGDALAAVMGHALDLIDIDPRNGGSIQALDGAVPTVLAAASTPSGGRHLFVLGLGTGSHDNIVPGVDVKGGRQDGTGRGFAWIAPTVRISKVTGQPCSYSWSMPPSADLIGECAAAGDGNGERLAELVLAAFSRASARKPLTVPVPDGPADVFATAARVFTMAEAKAYLTPPWEGFRDLRDGVDTAYNAKLNALAVMVGHFVPAFLDPDAAGSWLWTAAAHNGSVAYQGTSAVEATIRSGLAAGMREPYARRRLPGEDSDDQEDGQADNASTSGDALDALADASAAAEADGPSTWEPEDLSAILDGTFTAVEPMYFERADGAQLLYPGLVHSFHGESESGKSLVAQHVCAERLRSGGTACYVDFESDAPTVVGRILQMGATPDQIKAGLTYLRPAVIPTGRDLERFNALMGQSFDVAIIDGVTESMGIFGVRSSMDNDEVTRWMRAFPRRMARQTRAAVVLIDHVTKSSDGRGRFAIGAQAKLAGLDGAAYTIDVRQPLGRGMRGAVSMRIAKDRPGAVRPTCGTFAEDRTQEAAYIIIDSSGADGRIVVDVRPPLPDEDRRADLMVAVSMAIEGLPESLSQSEIVRRVRGKAIDVRHALNQLVVLGNVELVKNGRSFLHKLVTPYRKIQFDPQQDE
jgi:hypothetical protein